MKTHQSPVSISVTKSHLLGLIARRQKCQENCMSWIFYDEFKYTGSWFKFQIEERSESEFD